MGDGVMANRDHDCREGEAEAELDELVVCVVQRCACVSARPRRRRSRENFDFQDAKREQALEGRTRLGDAWRVVSEEEMNSEGVGNRLHRDGSPGTGSVCTYTIVGAVDADPA